MKRGNLLVAGVAGERLHDRGEVGARIGEHVFDAALAEPGEIGFRGHFLGSVVHGADPCVFVVHALAERRVTVPSSPTPVNECGAPGSARVARTWPTRRECIRSRRCAIAAVHMVADGHESGSAKRLAGVRTIGASAAGFGDPLKGLAVRCARCRTACPLPFRAVMRRACRWAIRQPQCRRRPGRCAC